MGFTELFQPKIIQVMKDIPVLGSGKIDYMELKKLAETINFDQIPSEED
jgi:acyl-coenzyme A synthetase/AMP-(fatty) acid ligase